MPAPIDVKCLQCGKSFRVKGEFAGKKGKCPVCGKIIQISDPNKQADLLTVDEGVSDNERRRVAASIAHGAGIREPEKKKGFFARLFGGDKKKK